MKRTILILLLLVSTQAYCPLNHFEVVIENEISILNIIEKIAFIESGFDISIINKKENAVGLLQIRQPVIDDVNHHFGKDYSLKEMHNPLKAITVMLLYQKIYKVSDNELYMLWNGGPNYRNKNLSVYKSKYNSVNFSGYELQSQTIRKKENT